jgi:hypothetical protein
VIGDGRWPLAVMPELERGALPHGLAAEPVLETAVVEHLLGHDEKVDNSPSAI